MDYNALQHKLFAMDPTDPAEDLAKLRAQAGGNAPAPAPQAKPEAQANQLKNMATAMKTTSQAKPAAATQEWQDNDASWDEF